MQVRSIRLMDELRSISDIWKRVFDEDPCALVSQSWEWNRIWCERVLPERRNARLDVKILEDDTGHPQAILPLIDESVLGPMLHFTRFIGHRSPGMQDILMREPDNPDLARSIVATLIPMLDSRTILHLRQMRQGSPFTRALAGRGMAIPQDTHMWLRADPAIEDQSARLGKSGRKNYRRRLNRLRQEHEVEFRVCAGAEYGAAFDEHMRVHELRWRQKSGESLIQDEQRDFLRAATSLLSRQRRCEILQLRADGRVIASNLRLLEQDRYHGISSGFDPAYARFSPMRILLTEAMRRGFDDLGYSVFDFGTGYDNYKLDWKPEVESTWLCCISGRSLYAKTMAGACLRAFRARLPETHLDQEPVH